MDAFAEELRVELGLPMSVAESRSKAGIVLISSDFALDGACPISPAFKMIGALLAEPGKPLPAVC